MLRGFHRILIWRTTLRFLFVAIAGVIVCSTVGASEILTIDEIKTRLKKNREKIESLYLEIEQEEKPCVDLQVLLELPRFTSKILLSNKKTYFAFKGEKRYHRTVFSTDSKYLRSSMEPPKLSPGADKLDKEMHKQAVEGHKKMKKHLARSERRGSKLSFAKGPVPDETRAYNGKSQWQRTVDRKGDVKVMITHPGRFAHWFGPTAYLCAAAMTFPDPTTKDGPDKQSQVLTSFPDALEKWPYTVSDEIEEIDGTKCLVLTGKPQITVNIGDLSQTVDYTDKIWLDLEHGLAVRQRELCVRGSKVRTTNSDFCEILPGVWLPKKSKTPVYASAAAPEKYRGRPVTINHLTLIKCVVNKVPDDIFDLVTKPGERVRDLRNPQHQGP